jgi:predicted transposase/invertase (TIGR01784 family)
LRRDITSYKDATGIVAYNMTNDYMFRAVLEANKNVLKGLICSILHLNDSDITSVEIKNPIKLGEAVDDKEFILDINVLLNDNTRIDLEMQVINFGNWAERSLSYLCRSYDSLRSGQDYREAMAAIHIGFLDFTLFEDYPEFYATYKMMNVKNHHIYSDKLRLGVVDLTHIELATDEDRAYGIDKWAALFKARTWEELKALGSENMTFDEAAETLFKLSANRDILEQCRRRNDYYRDIQDMKDSIAAKDAELADKDAVIADKDTTIAQQNTELADKDAEILKMKAEMERLNKLLSETEKK